MKKLISLVLVLGLISCAATYNEYEKVDTQIKVGKVYYQQWTIKDLEREKQMIEDEYASATQRYNEDIARINLLIVEAKKLGL